MAPWLLAAVLLGSPRFAVVRECAPSPTVGWQNTLYRDPAPGLFRQEDFREVSWWGDAAEGDPTASQLIADCFGDPAPHSGLVILHALAPLPGAPAHPRPVLLVPGAGDNAIRSYTFMALSLRAAGFQTYALTFAHRHGDNFQQAEQVANALAVIGARHPGVKIDVIAHSKGGMPARIYASNHPGADWSTAHPDYDANGTRYRGDIGRLFFLGSPLGGIDTAFRWPSSNFFAVYGEPLDSPASWTTFYLAGNRFFPTDLSDYQIYAPSAFAGQAQMLARWDEVYALPGETPLLGIYAVQQDWWTTYYGGAGFVSDAPGIETAIEDGGATIAALGEAGLDPDIELYLAAGGNPVLSSAGFGGVVFQLWWSDADAAGLRNFWQDGVQAVLDLYFPWWAIFEDDLDRLAAGTAFLGEISGPSDGLLFVDSALDEEALGARGAQATEVRLFRALNHVELLAAGSLFSAFHADRNNGFYDPTLAARYAEADNQIVEWIIARLSQPVPEAMPAQADAGPPDAAFEDAAPQDAAPQDAEAVDAAPDAA
ncbi:MAG: hypothetical protein KC620_18765, partial [Myxococcales bacterium]|nr:hypothetical protein [Myxococcales bacterium]